MMKPNIAASAKTLLGMGMIAASASAWCQQSASATNQVLEVEKKIAAATTADELQPYYAADVVLYDMLVPSEFHGWKAVHDDFAAQFAQVKNPKIEILNITAFADGTFGYAYSTQRFSFDLADKGPHSEIVFRQTDFLKKIKGHWQIVHQHLSVPYDPATGKAVLSPPPPKSP